MADGATIEEPSRKVKTGERYVVDIPEPEPATPLAQARDLEILFEDGDLIVVDKPAGMVVHPAPGNPDGTLVNALLPIAATACPASAAVRGRASSTGSTRTPRASWSRPRPTPPTRACRSCSPPTTSTRAYIALAGRARAAQGDDRRRDRPPSARPQEDGRASSRAARRRDPLWRRDAPSATAQPPASLLGAGWRPAAPTRSACIWPNRPCPASAIRSMAPGQPPLASSGLAMPLTTFARQALHAAVLGFGTRYRAKTALRKPIAPKIWQAVSRELERAFRSK